MQMLFALFGGLAMFLYGMDRMSRALQRAAGDAMKRLLARLTATPLLGVLTGLAVTAVLQSSSAATVMVIGCWNCPGRWPSSTASTSAPP